LLKRIKDISPLPTWPEPPRISSKYCNAHTFFSKTLDDLKHKMSSIGFTFVEINHHPIEEACYSAKPCM